jgi:hypothetical protein
MPVTVKPAPHGANAFLVPGNFPQAANVEELFQRTCWNEANKLKEINIIQSSFEKLCREDVVFSTANGKLLLSQPYSIQSNKRPGFVDAAILAYNQHYKLLIRPEDIWFSILTQLNAYINANAEELRDLFVSHEGQKDLQIVDFQEIKGNAMFGVDWGKFSFKMSKMIAENIKDPSLREWILPTFTTTTKCDQAVASILMMSAMQKYFTYSCAISCGLPSVTLLGVKEDWQKLEKKLERLPTFGKEPAEWYTLLKPVVQRFVKSFDEPDSEETKDFWQRIAHYSSGGSGPTYLSGETRASELCFKNLKADSGTGWITAFCFWDEDGKPLRPKGWADRMKWMKASAAAEHSDRRVFDLELDGAYYHCIDCDKVPRGVASVPVQLIDDLITYESMMVAGSVGMRISSSGELLHGKGETGLDTVQPESGWWIYQNNEKEQAGSGEEDMFAYYS